jgi:hypothetical protein
METLMHHLSWFFLPAVLPCIFGLLSDARAAHPTNPGVYATVETTLPTAGKQIRMFAFDGDAKTYFASAKNPDANDHFTLVLDKPVAVTSIVVTTGKPEGGDALDTGTLQVSPDGKTFQQIAKFADGVAKAFPKGQKILAIRIKPTGALDHPLAIREITIVSNPSVAIYKYPVEYTLIVDDAPEMKEWGEKVIRECERRAGQSRFQSADHGENAAENQLQGSRHGGTRRDHGLRGLLQEERHRCGRHGSRNRSHPAEIQGPQPRLAGRGNSRLHSLFQI